MERIREAFAKCRLDNRSALVAYVTAGYPTVGETVDILLAMEAGGAGEL
jgi:tryptophan synthase